MGYKDILLQRKQAEVDNTPPAEKIKHVETAVVSDISKNLKFFGVEQVNAYPPCIDLRLKDGNSKALPYSYIVEVTYNPSEGIEILTATKRILIEGRNLQMLYNHLVGYRVKYIQACIGKDLMEDKDLFVKSIQIEEL